MQKIPLPNTPEGMAFRKDKIGSSDAPVIMGVSTWKTERELFDEKAGLGKPIIINEAMQRGIDMEPVARKDFENMVGHEFPAMGALHPTEKWLLSSADGWCESEKQILEIKVPGKKDHELGMQGVVPQKYVPQLQHHMNVWETEFIWYFSWNENSHNAFKYYRNDNYIKKMVAREKDFYDRLINFDPPEEIKETFKQIESGEWKDLLDSYLIAELKEKTFAEEKERLKLRMIEVAQNENVVGNGYVLKRQERRGNIDYKKIPELKGRDLEEFRSPSVSFWKIEQQKSP